MENLIHSINQNIFTDCDGYKLEIETIIPNLTYCIKIRNSIQEGYFDKIISKKQLLDLIKNKSNITEIFNTLRKYTKTIGA